MSVQKASSSLCDTCTSIDARQPYGRPESVRSGDSFVYRIFYRHHDSLNSLKVSANGDCCLCGLILRAIERYAVDGDDDDWEQAGLLFEEFNADETQTTITDDIRRQKENFFQFSSPTPDAYDPSGPILVAVTFRRPMRDELPNRCTDIEVHWTYPAGVMRKKSSGLSLVSGLSGEPTVHVFYSR
jgi:hypothetical protein